MGPANLKIHHDRENNGSSNHSVIYIESEAAFPAGSPVILVAVLVCI